MKENLQKKAANCNSKHREAWKLINSIFGQKNDKPGILEGKDQAETVQNWYKHYWVGRLISTIIKQNQNFHFRPIIQNMWFYIERAHKARSRITLGKTSGSTTFS